jgi:plasmid maintenance system antidote protein VapI
MEIKNYISIGTEKLGSQKALAEFLGIPATSIRNVNCGRQGLSNVTCVKLAQLIETDPLEVIAASELVTEKKPEKRAFWERLRARARDIDEK